MQLIDQYDSLDEDSAVVTWFFIYIFFYIINSNTSFVTNSSNTSFGSSLNLETAQTQTV